MSHGPFKCKNLRMEIDNVLIQFVQLADIKFIKNGGVEPKYGMRGIHSDRRHRVGKQMATFTIRRWFKADVNTSYLFYSIHENDTEFDLKEYLGDVVVEDQTFRGFTIENCKSYGYNLITGTPNDIICEEITGYGLVTYETATYYATPAYFSEPVDSAYFKRQGEIWLADPDLTDGGGYYDAPTGEVYVDDPFGYEGAANLNPAGGAYFVRG